MIFITRLSAIPSHFSTAVFATCGVNFWLYVIASLLTLPKQIFFVYLGAVLAESTPHNSTKHIVFVIAFAITIIMAVYIWWRMRAIKAQLLQEQEARRQNRLAASGLRVSPKDAVSSSPPAGDTGTRDEEWLLAEQGQREREYENLSREEHGVVSVLPDTGSGDIGDARELEAYPSQTGSGKDF